MLSIVETLYTNVITSVIHYMISDNYAIFTVFERPDDVDIDYTKGEEHAKQREQWVIDDILYWKENDRYLMEILER